MTQKRNSGKKAQPRKQTAASGPIDDPMHVRAAESSVQSGGDKKRTWQGRSTPENNLRPLPTLSELTGFAIQLLAGGAEKDFEEAIASALTVWRRSWNALKREEKDLQSFHQPSALSAEDRIAQDKEARIWRRVRKDYGWVMSDPQDGRPFDQVVRGFFGSESNPDQAMKEFLERNSQEFQDPVPKHLAIMWAQLRAKEDFEEASVRLKHTRAEEKKAEWKKNSVDGDFRASTTKK